ncbi:nicotinamide-nucleotide amidase [Soonwooa buanensis]|uniref:CinA-like protein n=1 Tax=Soonwooa buanensis TaxID=619805 RepID=A0A1T5EUP6_9FLAO|nr:CinA family nicotinamide mononucleotide deamidase-related protein [Soonwooa buanensis]SKB87675.1 nicotinamide-nucleotide amidase [Soonwooa buanensis]
MKNAILITIGDEILSGNTIDTNSNFIATELKSIGISVKQIFTISDEIEVIKSTLKDAFDLGDLVITTGGLGPTRDDKTKKAFLEFFDDELISDEKTFKHLSDYLISRNRQDLLELNKSQADVLSKAIVFQNDFGTAPCQMIEQNGKLVFSLPGVPYEVKPLIKDKILPYLKEKFELDSIFTRIVSVVNVPESILAERIADWEDHLPSHISLSYLPIGNRVKLRITASGKDFSQLENDVETQIQFLLKIIGENVIATYEDKIEKILGEILTDRKLSISTTESCTGGEISKLITSVSGSSKYFLGGIVTYATQKKIDILKVSKETVAEHTVVSEEVALEMARGGQKLFGTNICLSTTGVAGPSKGEDGKDVGTVFYSIRIHDIEKASHLYLPYMERTDFMNFVAQRILQDLVAMLVQNH